MSEKILITGATGNVGKETIRKLLNSSNDQIEIIAGVRDLNKAKKSLNYDKLSFVKFGFKNKKLIKNSLKDIDEMLLIHPPAISKVQKYIHPVIKEAKHRNIKK
ncbi:MAG: NAD(P)H-binding protein [Bacillota bacterium]